MNSSTVRVAVDGLTLGEPRGIGNYLRNELAQLTRSDDVEVHLLVPEGAEAPEGVVAHPMRRALAGSRFADREHDLRLARDLAAIDADVTWSPAQHPPRSWRRPWVQTLHDLIPLLVDDPALARDRRRWRRNARRLAGAARVIAVSGHTASAARTVLGLDSRRIEVVHHGLDPRFVPAPPDRVRADGDEPYVLMVGAWAPYKGYPEAMDVVSRLADAGLPHRLRIVGPNDAWMVAQAEAQRRAAALPERVELVGWVDDLRAAYWDADVVLVSSRHEGFGLPLLEAMGCGAAVVTFDNTALPEVAGDGAVLVADGDVEAMAKAAAELVRDPSARADLGRRARARAATFSWERSAAAVADILRAAQGSAA